MGCAYGALGAAAFGKSLRYVTSLGVSTAMVRAGRVCLLFAGATASLAIALRVFAGLSSSVAAGLLGTDAVAPILPRFQCPVLESGVGAFGAIATAIALGGIGYWLRYETRRASNIFAMAGAAMFVGAMWLYQNGYVAQKVLPVGRSTCVSYYANPELFDSAVLVSDVTLAVMLVGTLLRVVTVLRD